MILLILGLTLTWDLGSWSCNVSKRQVASPLVYSEVTSQWPLARMATHWYERQIPWPRGQVWFRTECTNPAIINWFWLCMHFVALRAKIKNALPTYEDRKNKKKNDPAPRVAFTCSQKNRALLARANSRAMMGRCLLAPLLFLWTP